VHRIRRALSGYRPVGRFFGPGELRLALLALIAEEPGHGYQLMTRLSARSGGAYQPSAGAIYPTLQQLEDEGLIRPTKTGEQRAFEATAAGRREIEARAADLAHIWRRAAAWGDWSALSDPNGAEVVGPALRLAKAALRTIVHAHGDPATIDEVRHILEEARLRIERLGRGRTR
jgi:DNA-binding PadR family transcriptional regulator